MANFFGDNSDLRYYLEKGIDWTPLVRLTEYDHQAEEGFSNAEEAVEFYRDILDMVGRFSAEEIAPKAAEIDRLGLSLEDGEVHFSEPLNQIFEKLRELGLHGMCLPRELGGMNCPLLLYFLNSELIARADVSVMAHHGFHGGIAMAMLMYSLIEGSTEFATDPPRITRTRFQREIEEIATGQAWGAMDITEANAGSDMAALRCVGEQDEEGNWSMSGEKLFITSGHAKYHFVIARTEKGDGPVDGLEGLKRLSLFLVPTYEDLPSGERNWFSRVERLEEKLGHHGSATVAMSFDNTPALLIGKRGEGFKQMLMLMNTARIGVGFEALGLCEAALRLAREYASERPSMGKTIDRHELIADYLDEMESDIEGIRALAIYGAFHEEMGQKLGLLTQLLPDQDDQEARSQQKEHQRRSRLVTPLLKYLAAEKAVEISRRCIQILGGVGYTSEFGAEKLLRDAVVFPIYEGTSQIQSLMAMKDTMVDVMRRPQAFVQDAASAGALSLTARDPLQRRVAGIQSHCLTVVRHLMSRVALDKFRQVRERPVATWIDGMSANWDPKRDFAPALLHAERLTRMLADKAVCEILLEQAMAHPERKPTLERYLERAEPRVRYLREQITNSGSRILDQLKEPAL